MHQSPEKMSSHRRDKYGDADLAGFDRARRAEREAVPKARGFTRDAGEDRRDARWERDGPRRT